MSVLYLSCLVLMQPAEMFLYSLLQLLWPPSEHFGCRFCPQTKFGWGGVIWQFCFTWASSLNQFPITVGFTPIAWAIDKFCAFLTWIPGLHLRNPLNHFLPAVWDSSLNPVMPLILAYWKANWHTWLMVRGNPLSWKSFMVVAKAVSSAGRKIKQHLDLYLQK